jgi:hypothetical protein
MSFDEDLNYGVKLEKDQSANKSLNSNPLESNRTKNSNDRTLPYDEEKIKDAADNNNYNLSNASHPIACIFTFIFKVVSFLV